MNKIPVLFSEEQLARMHDILAAVRSRQPLDPVPNPLDDDLYAELVDALEHHKRFLRRHFPEHVIEEDPCLASQ